MSLPCEHASLIMQDLGMEAEYVTSGPLAVAEVRSGIEAGQPYDIVLVDLKMPDMDGIETHQSHAPSGGGQYADHRDDGL